MQYLILVDYDNLEISDKRSGLVFIAEKIAQLLTTNEVRNANLAIRLYGGWYSRNSATKLAQGLATEIAANFPITTYLSDKTTRVLANVELANALLILPGRQLPNTLRYKGFPSGLDCNHPNIRGCTITNCPIVHVHSFIKNGYCKACSIIGTEDIIFRMEQKLVDTMITSDIIINSINKENTCIVSSDDDMWPGILTSLTLGCSITQILTKQRTTPQPYVSFTGKGFLQKSL